MKDQDSQIDAPVVPQTTPDEGITVFDLLIVLAKHKRIVVGIPLGTALIATAVLLLLPNIYTATARIMPPQQSQSAAALALSSLASVAGGAGAALGPSLGLKNPSDLYVGLLRTQTIADRMIERFKLKERFAQDTLSETREKLADVTNAKVERDGLISIAVDDKDPAMAANMANAYVEELHRLVQGLAVTEASQRRLFFERELTEVRTKLADSEIALQVAQEKTGLIQPSGQAQAIFDAFAEVRAKIAAKEIELTSMRAFATRQNPTYVRVEQELIGLKTQLMTLEKGYPERNGKGNVLVPTSQIPEAGLEHLRRVRDVKYYETLYEALAKQFELAKIEESKDAGLIQAVDLATPPDRKSKPKRAILLVLSVLCAGVLAALYAIGLEVLRKEHQRPDGARRVQELRAYLRWW
jgi:uncharacterized protein involved in exopolysaccharide biosynthesis